MKRLSQYLDITNASERIERKFILSSGQGAMAKGELLKFGFKPHHAARLITSYYFDTYEMSSLRDNVDGNPNRDKLRVRYYNENIQDAKIEIKHKRAELGYKSTFFLPTSPRNEQQILNVSQDWIDSHVYEIMKPTARICYFRKYFIKDNCRATIDYEVYAQKIVNRILYTSTYTNYSVVEFKYQRTFDNDFRMYRYFSSIALRNTKSSKYANCMMH